jgi:hypothetical protein
MLVGQFQQNKSTPATAVPPSSVPVIGQPSTGPTRGPPTWPDRQEAVRGRGTPRRVFID